MDDMSTCSCSIYLTAHWEEPWTSVFSLLSFLSLCPFCQSEALLGTWAASCYCCMEDRDACHSGAGLVPGVNPQDLGVCWLWTGTQEPLHRCVLQSCGQEDGGVAVRVFFHETFVFILQVFYLDENKSFTGCVSLQYPLSALPPPPSLLPALWKLGSEQLTGRLEPAQISSL